MAEDLLSAFEPKRHLQKLVLLVCRAIGNLRQVDVQPLRVLGVEVIA